MAGNMALAPLLFLMALKFRLIGIKPTSKVRAKSSTPTAISSTANTPCLKNTAKACTFGAATTLSIKASSKRILWKVRPKYILPPMSTFSAESEMANETAKALTLMKMAIHLMVSGKMITS